MHIISLAENAAGAPALNQARQDESLLQAAIVHGPSASVWQMPDCLVVPRTYRTSANFPEVSNHFSNRGLPIEVRHSGGGVVPQGKGILNISLAWCQAGKPLAYSDTAYQFLCAAIGRILSHFNIASQAQAIEGSFCDGRFNVASSGTDGVMKKIAGTAQLWRQHRIDNHADRQQVVLVHALLLVACDISQVTAQANALERALGHDKRYKTDAATTLYTLMGNPSTDRNDLMRQVIQASITELAALMPPQMEAVLTSQL